MKLYLDTNIVIYYVERNPGWYSKVNARFSKLVPGRDRIVLSDLTIAECLVGPFKLANPKLEATYRRFFAGPDIDIASLSRPASERGARLRADHKFGSWTHCILRQQSRSVAMFFSRTTRNSRVALQFELSC